MGSEKPDCSRKYQSAEHQCFCLELSLQIQTAALGGELCARSSLVFASQQSEDISASLAVTSFKSLLGNQSSMWPQGILQRPLCHTHKCFGEWDWLTPTGCSLHMALMPQCLPSPNWIPYCPTVSACDAHYIHPNKVGPNRCRQRESDNKQLNSNLVPKSCVCFSNSMLWSTGISRQSTFDRIKMLSSVIFLCSFFHLYFSGKGSIVSQRH